MIKKGTERIRATQGEIVPRSRRVSERELLSTVGIHVEKRKIIRREQTDAS